MLSLERGRRAVNEVAAGGGLPSCGHPCAALSSSVCITGFSRSGLLVAWSGRACSGASVVSDSVTPWTVARQPPLSVGFSREEHWSGLPFAWGTQDLSISL